MIESKNNASKNLEKALQALTQAKQRVANEKKKQNEKKRKSEVIYSPFGEQVSLAMDNTNKLVYAEGIVCLATVKRGKG
jgi:hypothetical protein